MGFLISTCKQCGKKGLSVFFEDGLCGECQSKNYQAEKEAARKKREEEDAARIKEIETKKNAAEDIYQRIVDEYEVVKQPVTGKILDLWRRDEAICKLFLQDVPAAMKMPYFAEVLNAHTHETYYSYSNCVEIDGLGRIEYERIDSGNVKLNFNPLLKQAEQRIEQCQRIYEKSDEFEKLLKSLSAVPVNIDAGAENRERIPNVLEKTANITARTSIATTSNFIAIDVETTGLNPSSDDVIEVAAIRFLSGYPIEYFHTYVKPHDGLKPKAQKINGITEDQVKDAPYFEQINAALCDFLGEKATIVGHNLPFDYSFLTALGAAPLVIGKRKFYDTLDLARREFGFQKNRLDDLGATVLGIARNNSHTALSDALVAGLLFLEICKRRIDGFV